MLGSKCEEEQEAGENYIVRSFISCTLHETLLVCSNKGGWDGLITSTRYIRNSHKTFVGKPEGKR